MLACLRTGRDIYLPSKFWDDLNRKNLEQLQTQGLENLKRTVAQNYFTWVVGIRSDQFRFLARQMQIQDWGAVLTSIPKNSADTGLGWFKHFQLCVFTRMLWLFALRSDVLGLLNSIDEPAFGNPFPIRLGDRLISQDLANSVLELYSMNESRSWNADNTETVCELGAGYGRTAYAFMKARPGCKYIIVDIPPALYVSQRYLTEVLPDKRIAPFCSNLDEVQLRDMIAESDLIFLLPHQAEMLTDKSIDLFINISSLHEMTMDQVSAYFGLIDRKTRGRLYLKQWKRFFNAKDNLTISESDYPYPERWRLRFSRTTPAQPSFFEAVYDIENK